MAAVVLLFEAECDYADEAMKYLQFVLCFAN